SAHVEQRPRSAAVTRDVEAEWRGEFELGGYPRHVTLTVANRLRYLGFPPRCGRAAVRGRLDLLVAARRRRHCLVRQHRRQSGRDRVARYFRLSCRVASVRLIVSCGGPR